MVPLRPRPPRQCTTTVSPADMASTMRPTTSPVATRSVGAVTSGIGNQSVRMRIRRAVESRVEMASFLISNSSSSVTRSVVR